RDRDLERIPAVSRRHRDVHSLVGLQGQDNAARVVARERLPALSHRDCPAAERAAGLAGSLGPPPPNFGRKHRPLAHADSRGHAPQERLSVLSGTPLCTSVTSPWRLRRRRAGSGLRFRVARSCVTPACSSPSPPSPSSFCPLSRSWATRPSIPFQPGTEPASTRITP